MIILDTNVVSEAMKPDPAPAVRDWLNNQVVESLYISSVTVAELLYVIGSLGAGRRKEALTLALDGLMDLFKERVLPFDTDAARSYAQLAVQAKKVGRGFPAPDSYIAAIASSRGFIVASRDTGLFQAVNVVVINPWG